MKIIIKRSQDKQFYFTVNSRNGKVIMTSETYKRKPFDFTQQLSLLMNAKIIDQTKQAQ